MYTHCHFHRPLCYLRLHTHREYIASHSNVIANEFDNTDSMPKIHVAMNLVRQGRIKGFWKEVSGV